MTEVRTMGRVPPNDLEAELAVLGAILLDNDALGRMPAGFAAEDFYRSQHRILFAAMRELREKGEPIDTLTLARHLTANGDMDSAGGVTFVAGLTEQTPSAANVTSYATLVQNHARRRRAIHYAARLIDMAHDATVQMADLQASSNELLSNLEFSTSSKTRTAKEAAKALLDEIEQMNVTGVPRDITVGVGVIDEMFRIQRTSLTVIGAAPATGKTHLAMQIAEAMSKRGERGLYVSAEMPDTDLVARAARAYALFDEEVLWRPSSPERVGKAADAIWQVGKLPLLFSEETNAETVLSLIRERARRKDVTYVCIDMLQRLHLPASWGRTLDEQLGEFTKRLKHACLHSRVPAFLLSSFNRSDHGERPTMRSLRGSGSIESDADNVLLLHRLEGEFVEFISAKGRAKADKQIVLMKRRFDRAVFEYAEER